MSGWTVVEIVPPHRCALPNGRERRRAGMGYGTRVRCNGCGAAYEWTPSMDDYWREVQPSGVGVTAEAEETK